MCSDVFTITVRSSLDFLEACSGAVKETEHALTIETVIPDSKQTS